MRVRLVADTHRDPRRTGGILTATSCLAILAGCASNIPRPGQSLPGLQLDGKGAFIQLQWTPDSMVNRVLRPGVTVEVVADYPTATGRVTGDAVGSTILRPGQSALQIPLSQTLKHVPTDDVCLRIRLNGRTALPIRAGGVDRGATDEFMHTAWSRSAMAATATRTQEEARVRAKAAIQTLDLADQQFTDWQKERHIGDEQQCTVVAPANTRAARPRSVVEPSAQAETAMLDCSYRYRRLFATTSDAIKFAATMERTFSAEDLRPSPDSTGAPRATQARRLLSSLQKVEATISRPDFQLTLPIRQDLVPLRLTSTADELWGTAKHTGSFRKLFEPVLDAYASCVKDTRAQLALSFDTWTREQSPAIQRPQVELLHEDCRQKFREHARRQVQRTRILESLQPFDISGPGKSFPSSDQKTDLLPTACK